MNGTLRSALAGIAAVSVALAIGACGATTRVAPARQPLPAGNRIAGNTLSVYVSAPLRGGSRTDGAEVVNAATLALDQIHGRIGRYHIALKVLDDVSPGGMAWSGAAATLAAQKAAADRTTIAYLGDLDSGASAVSIPILNRLGIAQVSPYSGAVGLTSNGPGSLPGQPQAYYPTTLRTFARVVPSDYVQAQVQVALQHQLGCHATYVLFDDDYDGEAATAAFSQVAQTQRLRVIATQSYVPDAPNYLAVGQTIQGTGADCVLIAATTGRNAVKLVTQVADENPGVRLFATAGLAQRSFLDPALGGIPSSLDSRLLITAPSYDPTHLNALARAFRRRYQRVYGPPGPAAVNGYAAMQLVLDAIRRGTDGGRSDAQRVRVTRALFSGLAQASVLGRFHILRNGNTNLRRYGVFRVVRGGLRYWKTMTG